MRKPGYLFCFVDSMSFSACVIKLSSFAVLESIGILRGRPTTVLVYALFEQGSI